MTPLRELLTRARQLPPRRLPRAVGRYALRTARARARRWVVTRSRGELSDQAFLRAVGCESPPDAVALFRQGGRPAFFVRDPSDARQRAEAIATAYPHLAERTRQSAERALEHVFDLLRSGPVSLGPRIDWHTDFKVGLGWPADVLADDQDYLRLSEPCDVKVPWELSRCHHWVTLGRAYALDPDPRFAREFVAQLHHWLDANPWPYGVNWGRAMEVAVRAVNWVWAAALFDDAPEFDDRARLRLLKSLLQHGRHILDNLEVSDAGTNGNHYLSNGVGLLVLGVLFPEFADAAAWRRTGLEIVWGEIAQQVHPDGVDFEQAIGYQGLVVEFWYTCLRLCDLNAIPVPNSARERLARMFDFVLAYTRPDGSFPQIGDNDDGRLAGLDDEPVGSHRRHLAVGGAVFDRNDLLAAAGDAVETAVWLCGPDLLRTPRAAGSPSSCAFSDGGFYVLRSPDAVMVVDAGEVGMRGIGGHGHNDVLSFDLWAAGASLLTDSGTYVYTADPAARQALRATAAHNTVRVDGQEIARLGGDHWLWRIEDDAHPTLLRWESSPQLDVLEAQHDGYAPLMHRRRIAFDKQRCLWRIDDALEGSGEHLVELFLHPGAPIAEFADCSNSNCVRLRAPRADVWILGPAGLPLQQQPGWVSRAYGHREAAPVLVYAQRATLPITLTTGLVLAPHDTPLTTARSLFESLH